MLQVSVYCGVVGNRDFDLAIGAEVDKPAKVGGVPHAVTALASEVGFNGRDRHKGQRLGTLGVGHDADAASVQPLQVYEFDFGGM